MQQSDNARSEPARQPIQSHGRHDSAPLLAPTNRAAFDRGTQVEHEGGHHSPSPSTAHAYGHGRPLGLDLETITRVPGIRGGRRSSLSPRRRPRTRPRRQRREDWAAECSANSPRLDVSTQQLDLAGARWASLASLLQPPHPATGSTFTWAQEPRASHRTTRPVDNCNGALPARPLSLAERPRTPRGAPTRRRPLRFPEHRPRSMFVRDLGHHLRPVSRTPRDDPVEVKNCHPRRLRPPTARAKKRGGTRESGRGPGRAWGARYLLGRRGRIYQLRVERADARTTARPDQHPPVEELVARSLSRGDGLAAIRDPFDDHRSRWRPRR